MKYIPYRIIKKLEEIVSPSEVDINDISKLKAGLSGKIWDEGGVLKPLVRERMILLAKEFWKFLKLNYPIKDILFTGSLANYNWTSKSDADIHILFENTDQEDESLLAEFIDAKKDNWKDKHQISIYGFPVELFAKESEEEHQSKAIYSLLNNKWLKKPTRKNVVIDVESVKVRAADFMNKIDNLNKISDQNKKISLSEKIKNKLKDMRSAGLERGGEYSIDNLVYKTLRNNGYIDLLSNIKNSTYDHEMTLSEAKNNKPRNKSGELKYGCLMINFDIPNWKDIVKKINPEDIYNEPGFGISQEPHATILYGFHDDVELDDIKKATKKVINKPTSVKITAISTFSSKNSPFDVVKFDIESKELMRLNKLVSKFPHTSSFPDYHPHITLAYVKKGTGEKYRKEFEKGFNVTGNKMVYSTPSREKTNWSLVKKNILKVEKVIPGMTQEKIDIIKDFINFTCAKLKIEDPVTVVLQAGRGPTISTTAAYLPHKNENHIKAGGRSIVDLLRSISHELTHNRQRELGIFKTGEQVQNIGGKIENQANAIAGVLIKDFTCNYGYSHIYDL